MTSASMAGSMLEYVPTGPDSLPTATASRARRRPVPAAGHREREVGHPVPPDVGLGVNAVRPSDPQRAAVRERVVAQHRHQRPALASSRSVASASWMARAVSSRSDEVMPKCTYEAAARGEVLSAQAVRKAITSWSVTASAAATASADGGGACRTGSTQSAGTVPAWACASRTSVSTRLHSSYLCSSLQTRPISGSVYRLIMSRSTGTPPGPPASLPPIIGDGTSPMPGRRH